MVQFTFSAAGPDRTIRYAQEELARYLTQMLGGADAAIQIKTEVQAPSPLPAPRWDAALDDWFHVQAAPQAVTITGSNPRSVLLGVYRLLHHLGCRFLMPGLQHEVVPALPLERLRADLQETASCRHRGVCIEGADSLENILDFIDWLPKIGCNSFFVQHMEPEAFLLNWYDHKYNPLLPPEPHTGEEMQRMYRQIDEAIARRGLLHHRAGHGWTCRAIGFDHVCAKLPAPTAQQRPMLAEVNGKRDFWNGVPSNTNLCYADPQAPRAFVQSVADYAGEHPEVDFLHVWLADEYNNICECDACRKTTLSDQYVSLLNEIDAELTRRGLATRIAFLLYQELLWPPEHTVLENPDRFILMFAPISRTFERSYADHGPLPPLPPFRRNHIRLPDTVEENLAFLQAWQERCHMDAFVYDYPLGRAHYGDLGYCAIARVLAQDIRTLPALGLNGYCSCQELRAALPNAWPNYLMGHMLWDSSLDPQQLQEEYFTALYGPGAADARAALEELSALTSPDYFNGIGPRQDPEQAARFRKAEQAAAALGELAAKNQTLCTGMNKFAWELLDYHAGYCKLMAEALAALAAGETKRAQQRWDAVMAYIRSNERAFQPYLDVYRVLEVATKYTGFALDMPR